MIKHEIKIMRGSHHQVFLEPNLLFYCIQIINIIIQHIVTLPKYGHGELNICRPHITDILRYT